MGTYKGSLEDVDTLMSVLPNEIRGLAQPRPELSIVAAPLKKAMETLHYLPWHQLNLELEPSPDVFLFDPVPEKAVTMHWTKIGWLHDDAFITLKGVIRIMMAFDAKKNVLYIVQSSWERWRKFMELERWLEAAKKMDEGK